MSISLMDHEFLIRVAAFGSVFAVLALWELGAPRRRLRASKPRRWFTNWMIVILDTAVVRILFPAAAVGAAWDARESGWGLFNYWDAPGWMEIVLAMLLLDILIYGQHVASHKVPLLWRIHRVHHVDRDMDVTTAIRFHPIEIALSMVLKIGAVYALGASAIAVILFEIILNGSAMFNHANITIPRPIDRVLRWVLVTPDMHRVHHSVHHRETDANYGFNLPWWDRIFGTYVDQPRDGHTEMVIGQNNCQDARPTRLAWSLYLPFLNRIR